MSGNVVLEFLEVQILSRVECSQTPILLFASYHDH
jgi:hypothetical protein